MVKRISLVRIVGWCLIGVCPAVCQSRHTAAASGLPDAPSATVTETHAGQGIREAELPVDPAVMTMSADGGAITEIPPVAASLLPRQPSLYQPIPDEKPSEFAPLFFKRLTPALEHPSARYMASDRATVMGRAVDAASRIFVTRDETGRRKFNSPYLLRLATAVAADSASRRYRARSSTAPLSDFGSNVGNDAGMNLLHEFGPAMRKMATSHLPEFISRIGARVTR